MKDVDALQGVWSIVELEVNGRKMPAGTARIELTGDRFISTGMGANYEGQIQIDSSKKPKTLDMTFASGPEKGNTNLGIFEMDGNRWRLCLDLTGKSRPKKFASSRGVALETLHRVDEAEVSSGRAAAVAFRVVPAPELEGTWQMVSCTMSGQALPSSYAKYGKRVARQNELTVTMNGQVMVQARFTVDRTKSPMHIDYLLAGDQLQLGIYELKDGVLRTSIAAPGSPRPTDFTISPNDGRTVTEWRRTDG